VQDIILDVESTPTMPADNTTISIGHLHNIYGYVFF
jgi:hypothetical protein